jgi:predicted methyltransferase
LDSKRPHPPLLTPKAAKEIIQGSSEVSLDLGLSRSKVERVGEKFNLGGGEEVVIEDLETIAGRENAAFFVDNSGVFQLAISGDRYYKLVPTVGAPTLEIDGIRMHRTKGTTPERDAREKVEAMGIRGGKVLDTCTGLGYTAAVALERGAELVVTIERRPEVLKLASMNPWSEAFFVDKRSHPIIGDAYDQVDVLPEGYFDYVVHDPPRLTRAGYLYSSEFYSRLERVMRPGAKLLHYTGEPGSKYRRVDLRRGVMDRLRWAGFTNPRYLRHVMSVLCEKPD